MATAVSEYLLFHIIQYSYQFFQKLSVPEKKASITDLGAVRQGILLFGTSMRNRKIGCADLHECMKFIYLLFYLLPGASHCSIPFDPTSAPFRPGGSELHWLYQCTWVHTRGEPLIIVTETDTDQSFKLFFWSNASYPWACGLNPSESEIIMAAPKAVHE